MLNADLTLGVMRRNMGRLTSGALLSQLILVVATPILTRIYDPKAFGVFAIFSSAYAIVIPLSTFKFDSAIILPGAESGAIRLTLLAILVSTVIASSLAIVGVLVGDGAKPPLGQVLNTWFAAAIWFGALFTLTQQWSARNCDYSRFAKSQILGAVINVSTGIGLGYLFGGQAVHLVAGFVFAMACSVFYMSGWQLRPWFQNLGSLKFNLWRRAKVYRQFPLLVLPTSILVGVGQNSVPIILSSYYPLELVGLFAVVNRVLLLPAGVIGGAITEAFRSEFVRRLRNRQNVSKLLVTTLAGLAFVAITIFGFLALVASCLFTLAFGTAYEQAGDVARAFIIGSIAHFIGNPLASIFVALRRSALGFRMQLAITLLPISLLIISASFNFSMNGSLYIYSFGTAMLIALMIIVAIRICRKSDDLRGLNSGL